MVFKRDYLTGLLAEGIKELWKKADSSYLSLPEENGTDKRKTECRIDKSMEDMKEQMNAFPYPFGNKKRWKRNMEQMLDHVLWDEPLIGIDKAMSKETLDAFKAETKVFTRKIREFDKALSIEDMGQALRNYIVYAIFRELNGLSQKCTPAIFGYSMLYPYTDNFIDNPVRSIEEKNHFNKLISDKLSGNIYETVSIHEEKTAQLLSAIEEYYEKGDEIYTGLLLMLEAQKNSQCQAETQSGLSEEDILAISVYKGGLSVLIDRYFIDKPLSDNDTFFYYGFGFFLQLCDDLQDIAEDKQTGSRTLFSICGTKKETEDTINRLLHYTKVLFSFCECEREAFKEFLFRNCIFLILFSAAGSREFISDEWLAWAEGKMPVSIEYMDKLKNGFAVSDIDRIDTKYMKMIDVMLKE